MTTSSFPLRNSRAYGYMSIEGDVLPGLMTRESRRLRRRLMIMQRKPKTAEIEHILSLSYGKDSMACLGAIEQQEKHIHIALANSCSPTLEEEVKR